MIEFDHFPERWLKVEQVTAEKGKYLRAMKLRMLEVTELGAQLTIRMLLGSSMSNKVGEEKMLPKFYCGSRRGY